RRAAFHSLALPRRKIRVLPWRTELLRHYTSKLPAMKVVMWLGDNIQDFPTLGQEVRNGGAAGFAEFGRSWFVLPNPLYGSWDKNPLPL
ncbi:MAG: hypothetical protein ABJB74_12465, partial [Gemmatimonas sp.]